MTRYVVTTAWTGEASLSGYDHDEVVSTYPTREEAEAKLRRVSRFYLGTVDTESRMWCIGVGVAREPEPGYAPSVSYDRDGEWADCVPEEVLGWED